MSSYFSMLTSATFLYPHFLWLVPIALLGTFVVVRKQGVTIAGILRILGICLLLLAAATPVKTSNSGSENLLALVDISQSIPNPALDSFSKVISSIAKSKNDSVTVVPFGKSAASAETLISPSSAEVNNFLQSLRSGSLSTETNLEQALRSAVTSSEASAILLLSDGKQNSGDALAMLPSLKQSGVRIYPLVPNTELFNNSRLSISALYAPLTTFGDEHPRVHLAVKNGTADRAAPSVELWLGDEKFFDSKVAIAANSEALVSERAPVVSGGLKQLKAVLKEGSQVIEERFRWISVQERAKLLLLSGSDADAVLLRQLAQVKGYTISDIVAGGSTPLPSDFKNISTVIFNNVHKDQVSDSFLSNLAQFVRDGGGLVLVGGERSFGLGRFKGTILEQLSPVEFLPPQTEKRRLNNAVMLLIDKSRSMIEDRRIDSVQQAALVSLEALKDDDLVGVIGFDDAPFTIIKMDTVAKARLIAASRLRNLRAAGGTSILNALSQSRKALERADAGRKHLIVLSDGDFRNDSLTLLSQEVEKIARTGITISAVAVGSDADAFFLKELATRGNGAFYQTVDPSRLPEIFIKDIKVSTGERTLQERGDYPVYQGPDGIISTSLSSFPPVKGFVQTKERELATTELVLKDTKTSFPLLAHWKQGSGTVVAYTSDANGRWSAPWARWKGFSQFWSEVIESTKTKHAEKKNRQVDFDIRYKVSGDKLIFDLSIFDPTLQNAATPKIIAAVQTPAGSSEEIRFEETRKGRFEASLSPVTAGDYRMQLTYNEVAFPPLAVTIAADILGERIGEGVDLELLGALARGTGGMLNPAPTRIPRSVRTEHSRIFLNTPIFVAAFILLLLSPLIRERVFRRRLVETKKGKQGIHQQLVRH